jgi:hypothetical protein
VPVSSRNTFSVSASVPVLRATPWGCAVRRAFIAGEAKGGGDALGPQSGLGGVACADEQWNGGGGQHGEQADNEEEFDQGEAAAAGRA